jgi:phosphoacetylglucosamine mutase
VRSEFWRVFSGYFTNAANYLGWKQTIQRTVDCANGVGAKAMPYFSEIIKDYIAAELVNTSDDDYLNKECGADYVKTNKLLPRNFQARAHKSYLSFDGDADRIVF